MDTQSYIFLVFINVFTGWLADEILKDVIIVKVLNLRIYLCSIISVLIVSFLMYINVEILFLLNVFFTTALSLPLLFIISLYHMENFLIEYGTTTITSFISNNFKSTFVKKCKEGSLTEVQIFIIANNICTQYLQNSLLCNHCFGVAILESATNNHIDVLDLLLNNFDIKTNMDLAKKIITTISRLGNSNSFELLVNKTDIKNIDYDFYESCKIQLRINDVLECVKEDYNKALSLLDIKSQRGIHVDCDISNEKCMICHDPHDNILKLGCGHYVCLETLCSFYKQNPSEELKCFICRGNINIKAVVSYSKE